MSVHYPSMNPRPRELGPEEHFSASMPLSDRKALFLAQLDITERTLHVLEELGVITVGALEGHSRGALLGIKNFGTARIRDIDKGLALIGLQLADDGMFVDVFNNHDVTNFRGKCGG
ncbi:hypothetical protein A3C37_05430 [Candidatus Peribacteria bacterium RIFCSPHIGHO2_02_FULL_53_20]|nr:MAG: hypothetical protein A3C37_05430 [Candidatus Peribacteria bacterium RIFCSPHIGHO2_02_FULL_53_20]OGJ67633.1 MAG: hypothetical protein A3B61_02135 [Candidatus Peribacteria bacterium RIFCSPLOWO2_01_FULL_53_10]OGJ69481.1 MAG: hypothetical protein A3G69_00480 [Candidatus Peribacteria bacterium RIFCSPLOWO2_12_FULL_53_10]